MVTIKIYNTCGILEKEECTNNKINISLCRGLHLIKISDNKITISETIKYSYNKGIIPTKGIREGLHIVTVFCGKSEISELKWNNIKQQ